MGGAGRRHNPAVATHGASGAGELAGASPRRASEGDGVEASAHFNRRGGASWAVVIGIPTVGLGRRRRSGGAVVPLRASRLQLTTCAVEAGRALLLGCTCGSLAHEAGVGVRRSAPLAQHALASDVMEAGCAGLTIRGGGARAPVTRHIAGCGVRGRAASRTVEARQAGPVAGGRAQAD